MVYPISNVNSSVVWPADEGFQNNVRMHVGKSVAHIKKKRKNREGITISETLFPIHFLIRPRYFLDFRNSLQQI